jgi:hydrogenase/urease accessory protein HupE
VIALYMILIALSGLVMGYALGYENGHEKAKNKYYYKL